ncbi:MAG: hypothetical protein JXA44_00605 [Methanospirillaceae archaeon]|nr:hypothetical protein [Methanospirillaceae archaeon]
MGKALMSASEQMRERVTCIPKDPFVLLYALSKAKEPADVAGIRRECLMEEKEGTPDMWYSFGVDTPLSHALLSVLRFDPDIRSAAGILYSDSLPLILDEMLYDVRYARDDMKRSDTSLLDFSVVSCCRKNDVPDLIIAGSHKTAAAVWLFGENPREVVKSLIKISGRINNTTSEDTRNGN